MISATPEAIVAVCVAIRGYHHQTGRRVVTLSDAVLYHTIVGEIIGKGELMLGLLRIVSNMAAIL